MKVKGFTKKDFAVFEVPGLDERMSALKERIQPKFKWIGQALVQDVSASIGEECYVHIARHARRKVNPPNDSWLSFSTSARGYKMLPHFQIGMWSTHAFIQFGIIYECPRKAEFANRLMQEWDDMKKKIPTTYIWYDDHINPKPYPHAEMDQHIAALTDR